MKKTALLIFPVIFLLTTCALEIANVIGPGGGYVYYDKGNYKDGWRYKECSPFDIGELKDIDDASLSKALRSCIDQSDEWYAYNWEIPDEADMKKILECFSYGLTRFSPDYYYLSINGKYIKTVAKGDPVLYAGGEQVFYTGVEPVLDNDGDPVLDTDGKLVYHQKGDPVRDNDGNLVYHTKGEPVLDSNGKPVLHTEGYKILDADGYPVLDEVNRGKWEAVILHKNFEKAANGKVEKVNSKKDDKGNTILINDEGEPILDKDTGKTIPITIRVRPIRKF